MDPGKGRQRGRRTGVAGTCLVRLSDMKTEKFPCQVVTSGLLVRLVRVDE